MQPTETREAVEAAESPGAARRAPRPKPGERRIHILQTLATMLEAPRGEKITTAALAARLGVSEAALYRHFASKAQMYEGLIDFIEQTLFGLINQIVEKEPSGVLQARAIALMLVNFSTRNAGMTRVLTARIDEEQRHVLLEESCAEQAFGGGFGCGERGESCGNDERHDASLVPALVR